MDSHNNRRHFRLDKTASFIIEVKSRSPDVMTPAFELLVGDSLDLSANGIRAVVDRELPLNAIYELAVDLGQQEKLFLVGQVRWTAKAEGSDAYYVGVEILDSAGSDVQQWKLQVAELLLTEP